jgi:hypothetical protein
MLEQITWNNYWTAVAIILVFYYLFIAIVYYRGDIGEQLKKQLEARRTDSDEGKEERTYSSFNELEAIVADIKSSLEAAGAEASKEDLLSRIGDILANYNGLDTPAFRVAINNYVIGHTKKICNKEFNEEELDAYWQTIRG